MHNKCMGLYGNLAPFRRIIGISNVAALCPSKIVQTGFVDRVEAKSMLALKKVKNCLSTCGNAKASGQLSLKSWRVPLTVLTVIENLTFDLVSLLKSSTAAKGSIDFEELE